MIKHVYSVWPPNPKAAVHFFKSSLTTNEVQYSLWLNPDVNTKGKWHIVWCTTSYLWSEPHFRQSRSRSSQKYPGLAEIILSVSSGSWEWMIAAAKSSKSFPRRPVTLHSGHDTSLLYVYQSLMKCWQVSAHNGYCVPLIVFNEPWAPQWLGPIAGDS